MLNLHVSRRRSWRVAVLLGFVTLFPTLARGDQVTFDLPSSIECRDVTSPEFAAANPHLKMIEARLHISARMSVADPGKIVDFEYSVRTGKGMRVRDYSPRTTLESAVAEDNIEVTAAAETAKSTGLDAHIAYKPLVIGGSQTRSAKNSESSKYKQVAPQDTVLASGTIEREHGVFFRVRPSRKAALEGCREFTIVAVVPKTWRGDVCDIACIARAARHTTFSNSVVAIGECRMLVGMHLAGDQEAAAAAEELRTLQAAVEKLSLAPAARPDVLKSISLEAVSLFAGKKKNTAEDRRPLQEATEALQDARRKLEALAN